MWTWFDDDTLWESLESFLFSQFRSSAITVREAEMKQGHKQHLTLWPWEDGDRSCLGTYPVVSCSVRFAFHRGDKVRGEKVYEHSELGSEMPARRP